MATDTAGRDRALGAAAKRGRPCDRLVAKLSAVARLDEDDREAVHGICRHARRIAARQEIIAEGERPDHVHVVVEG